MSARAFQKDKEECYEAGMNAHIVKPIDPNVLYEEMAKFLPIASETSNVETTTVVSGDSKQLSTDDDEFIARPECGGTYRDILLYINSRVRVVDSDGNPMVGAKVYKDRCAYDDMGCQYVTDSDGYAYIDSVNFLTYWEKYEGALEEAGPEKAYARIYERLQLRAISADSSYGANIYASYSRASFVELNGEQVAELRPIALEPVYTTKLYLDSIHVLSSEGADEFIEENGFGICVNVKHAYDIYVYAEELLPSYFYPCQMVTEEDKKNGYVMVYGLPENVYWISIGNPNGQMSMGSDSLVVKRPN